MGRKVVQHRIFDLALLLLVVAVVTTLRSSFWPSESEAVANVATPIGGILQHWQAHIPVLSAVVWTVVLFVFGLGVGRLGVRYSIYPAYTLMGIPVFAVVASCVVGTTDYLLTAVAVAVMYQAMKSMTRFIMRTERFSDLSLAMLYFGVLPLVFAPAAVFYVAMPLLVLAVRASWRDVVVTLASVLLAPAAICYWGWCAGGEFSVPAIDIYNSLFSASGFRIFEAMNIVTILLLGVIIIMIVSALALTISDRYSIKSKSRVMLRFSALLVAVLTAIFCLPSATATLFALVAVPVAMFVPLFFVRMGIGFTETMYRLMLLAAAANIVVMAFL